MVYVVAEIMRKAQEDESRRPVLFGLEQPSATPYMEENVSFWWTSQWKALRQTHQLTEVHFNQGDWKDDGGHGCVKPTTIGGTIEVEVPLHRNQDAVPRSRGKIQDSKDLARWVPGLMKELAKGHPKDPGDELGRSRQPWSRSV